MRPTRQTRLRFSGAWLGLVAAGMLAIMGDGRAFEIGFGALTAPDEPSPTEPFSRGATDGTDSSAAGTTGPPSSSASAPSLESSAEPFSLGNFFSPFFELGAPGDPSHPDKLRFTVNTALGYDSNVLTSNTNPIASATSNLSGTAAYNFGSERLKITSSLALGIIYYDNRPGDSSDYNGNFSAAFSYFVTRRLQLAGGVNLIYASQPNPTLIGGVSRFSGDYTVANVNVSATYALRPRLSMRVELRENTIQYAEEDENQALGFSDQTYVLGLDYLFSPRITLTTEYRYNPLSYYESDQDSVGQIFTVGFVANFNPRLKWTMQAGVEGRSFDGETQPGSESQYFGPFLESSVEYDFAPNSSLVGRLRYGTEPSGVASLSIRETLRGSLVLRYAFTPRLTADFGLSYENDNYDQPGDASFVQKYFTGSIGLGFQFNPALSLTARFEYSSVQSDVPTDGYTRDVSTLGLQFIF